MRSWKLWLVPMVMVACGAEGEDGDACESDDDCADELHCHIEDGEGVCHSEDEHEDHTHEDHTDM